jgi:hypothetical protein
VPVNADAGRTLGRSGDDGVDGVTDQDALGLDRVYIQAKRYAIGNNIGSTRSLSQIVDDPHNEHDFGSSIELMRTFDDFTPDNRTRSRLYSAPICASLTSRRADHAQYLASWLAILKSDAIFTAASKASQAATFLTALQRA